MRFLLGLVALLAALYGGYWFVGQRAVERAADDAFAQMAAQGWDATHDGISTTGFPSRFDTTVTAPRLIDSRSGIGWEAPWLQVFALSYLPNRVIALFPETQEVILPGGRIEILSQDMRASGSVGAALDLPLDAVTVETGALTLRGDAGWEAGLDRALFALRQAGPGPADYDLWFEGTALRLPDGMRAGLPTAMPVVRVDTGLTLDRVLDRQLDGAARVERLALRDLAVDWGETGFTARGDLTLDATGVPEGEVTLTVRNWRAALGIAVAAGMLPQGMAGIAERAGVVLAGGSDDLTAPLAFTAGQMRLGPLPLGPAPALYAVP